MAVHAADAVVDLVVVFIVKIVTPTTEATGSTATGVAAVVMTLKTEIVWFRATTASTRIIASTRTPVPVTLEDEILR